MSSPAGPALAWVESPLQLLSAAEWADRRHATSGEPTRVAYRISDPQVVTTAEALSAMGAPFARFEPYYGIPWAALASSRHWGIGDPLSGHLFVFANRGGDRLKILWWDRDGLAIFYKRLEEGRFTFPTPGEGATSLEMSGADLQLVLQGIDPAKVKRSQRYQRPAA